MARERSKNKVRTIENSVLIRAQAEDIFFAVTDPGELVKWFPEHAVTDPELGGKYEFTWEKSRVWGPKSGIYIDIIPGTKLSFTWPVGNLDQYTIVNFHLHSEGGYTTVIFSHTGFGFGEEWEKEYCEHSELWSFFLENLKSYMEEGIDRRQEQELRCSVE